MPPGSLRPKIRNFPGFFKSFCEKPVIFGMLYQAEKLTSGNVKLEISNICKALTFEIVSINHLQAHILS